MIKKIQLWLSGIRQFSITLSLMFVGCILPCYYQHGYLDMGESKAVFYQYVSVYTMLGIGILSLGILLTQIMLRERGGKSFSNRDVLLLIFASSLCLSYGYSEYKEIALWGVKGWYMGLIPQLTFIGYYFFVSRFWEIEAWLGYIFLGTSGAVFLLGIVNRYDYYPINMWAYDVEFISTIGNINWFSGYWAVVFGISMGALIGIKNKKMMIWEKIAFFSYLFILLLVGLIQGSDSAFVSLYCVAIYLLIKARKNEEWLKRVWLLGCIICGLILLISILEYGNILNMNFQGDGIGILIRYPIISISGLCISLVCFARGEKSKGSVVLLLGLLGAIVLGYIFLGVINTMELGNIGKLSELALFSFDEDWGNQRGANWNTGWMIFKEQNILHKMVGIGPDAMWGYIYSGEQLALEEYVAQYNGNEMLTNAHNELLTLLVNVGLLGVISLIVAVVKSFLLYSKEENHWFILGVSIAMLSYISHNLFSFQQIMNTPIFFIFWGLAENCYQKKMKNLEI